MPAAPAPFSTTLTSSSFLPVMWQALIRPAAEMMAVPCWSSWKTGMSSSSCSSVSMQEAFGGLDVLQIDAAEGDADVLDHGDELVGVGGLDLDVDAVDVGEAFEQDGLALHHRLGRHVAEVAEAQDGRAVGDHGDQIALGRIVVGLVRDRRRSPAPARPRRANRPATGRAGSPSAWSAPWRSCPASDAGGSPALPRR